MRIALFQPDIPQNAGAVLRLAACMDVAVDIIEPCGFVFDDRRLRRAGMDYFDRADLTRHRSWEDFQAVPRAGRLVLLTTSGDTAYDRFEFRATDTLLMGRESAGVPEPVHTASDARIVIPLAQGARSLNVALAAAMTVGEALRQTGTLPETQITETA